jgi:hypothetical protein
MRDHVVLVTKVPDLSHLFEWMDEASDGVLQTHQFGGCIMNIIA